jgi:hypothetical protein
MNATRPEISMAESCYARGDFKEARRICRAIAEDSENAPADRARASKILTATGIDPVAIGAFALTAIVLVFLIAHYVF